MSNGALLGWWKAGDPRGAEAVPWIASPPGEERRDLFSLVYRLCMSGQIAREQLRFEAADRCFSPSNAVAILWLPRLTELAA